MFRDYDSLLAEPFKIHQRFHLGAKAPSYYFEKKVIELINGVADVVNNPYVRNLWKVVFIEKLWRKNCEFFPGGLVNKVRPKQGTGNMKFMMNGALTLGTRRGVEIHERVGDDHSFIFGLTEPEEKLKTKKQFNPWVFTTMTRNPPGDA